MKENINHFSLADLKLHMGIEDGLNDNVLIHDFVIGDELPKSPNIPGRADAVGIVICHEGEIAVTINARDFLLKSGVAAMILPNCIYSVEPKGMPARGTIFAVSASLLKDMHIDIRQRIPLGMHLYHNPCFHFSEKNMALNNRYIEMVRMVSQRSENHNLPMIHGILESMLAFVHEVMEQEVGNAKEFKSERGNNRNIRLFDEFMSLLTENFRSEHQIGFYADKLCLTPKYLSLLIKQTSGRSVSDWIDYCIIMEAKSLLRYSDMSIQQVAYNLHFPTPSFFGTYFKRHTGITPGEFRENNG